MILYKTIHTFSNGVQVLESIVIDRSVDSLSEFQQNQLAFQLGFKSSLKEEYKRQHKFEQELIGS